MIAGFSRYRTGDYKLNGQIALLLIQDGIVNGAVYALLALAIVLVFVVTRVLFLPQGEFVTYGALSLAALQLGRTPGIVWLLGVAGLLVAAIEVLAALRSGRTSRIPRILGYYVAVPAVIIGLTVWLAPQKPPLAVQIALSIALVVPLGPMTWRLFFQPLASASVLVLFIVSMAVHYVLTGLSLVFFGGEGLRSRPFWDAKFRLGVVEISAQSVLVVVASLLLILVLWLLFERSIYGKALRATAMNRVGALLVGIPTVLTGHLSFLLAAFIGAVSGILIAPITTLYYDTGFLIGLKGFVGAILGGMGSYPLAAVGSVAVGLLESFSSFWASAFKEVIVFTLIIPVLVWLSLRSRHVEEEEEQ